MGYSQFQFFLFGQSSHSVDWCLYFKHILVVYIYISSSVSIFCSLTLILITCALISSDMRLTFYIDSMNEGYYI